MLKGNKGEWSEVYTLLKMLSDRQLAAGDSSLSRIETLIFPIIKVLRDESGGTYEYSYDDDLVVVKGDGNEFRIPIISFAEKAVVLLQRLQKDASGSFSIPDIEKFMLTFNCRSLKAKSSVKSDIRVVIHDQRTGSSPELGFSIKSQLGGASTLLNASKATNFIYRIQNGFLSQEEIDRINSINDRKGKIRNRVSQILTYSRGLKFVRTENSVFRDNLMLIDTALPEILSELVCHFYTTTNSSISDLVDLVSHQNPMRYNQDNGHPYYSYKVKRFLTDVALGMMPASAWSGKFDSTGGYLIVKESGDILCYHIYNRNEFEDYLFDNTKLDTASSGRHDFGSVYADGSELFVKLNLQIRFKK